MMRRVTASLAAMLVFVKFPGSEQEVLQTAAEKLDMAHRVRFMDQVAEVAAAIGLGTATPKFPAVIFLNCDYDGWSQMLAEFKSSDLLKRVPVVGLGKPKPHEDVVGMYEAGANSFITKPETYEATVGAYCTALTYWINTTQLPGQHLANM